MATEAFTYDDETGEYGVRFTGSVLIAATAAVHNERVRVMRAAKRTKSASDKAMRVLELNRLDAAQAALEPARDAALERMMHGTELD